jgi:hypothetical protein
VAFITCRGRLTIMLAGATRGQKARVGVGKPNEVTGFVTYRLSELKNKFNAILK